MGNEKQPLFHGGSVLFGASERHGLHEDGVERVYSGVYPGVVYTGVFTRVYTGCGVSVESGRLEP